MDQYAVIADNGGSEQKYRDIVGEVYTFPSMYAGILVEGTKFIYQRCGKDSMKVAEPDNERLLDEPHYFGVAEIGPIHPVVGDRFEAQIINYKHFKRGVPFRLSDGTHFEIKPGQFWRNGVRETQKEVYDAILEASTGVIPITTPLKDVTPIAPRRPVPTKNTRKTATNRSSVQYKTELSRGLSSRTFANDCLQFVTDKTGYWLYNIVTNTYYLIAHLKNIGFNVGQLKLRRGLLSKDPIVFDDRKYGLVHSDDFNKIDIGTIEIQEDAIIFRDAKTSVKTMDILKIPMSIAL